MEYSLTSLRLREPLEDWPFREYVDRYIAAMRADRFSNRHTYHAVEAIGEFARWLTGVHGDAADVQERTVAAFLAWKRQRASYKNGNAITLARFLGVLRDVGAIAPPPASIDQRDLLLEAYRTHLESGRGFKAKSCASYIWFARPFVQALWNAEEGLAALTRADVIGYVERHAPRRPHRPS